jgi:hypothetical protein
MSDGSGLGRRLGSFLLLLGVIGLILFAVSDISGKAYYVMFCGGALLLLAGGFLLIRARSRDEPQDSGRFSVLRGSPREKKEKPKE